MLLAAVVYAPHESEVFSELEKLGFNPDHAEIIQGNAPLCERALIVNTSDVTYVVFRGTQNLAQWLSNINAKKVPVPSLGKRVRVHKGFFQGLEDLMIDLVDHLDYWKTRKIVLVGHSRGAAMATLAAQIFDFEGVDIAEIHCFGTPRSLDVETAVQSDQLFKEKMWRWVANNDTVCRVPFRWMGFKHSGQEYYYDSSDRLHKNPALWVKIKGQIRGRQKGGWFDGISDHDYVDEYVRLVNSI